MNRELIVILIVLAIACIFLLVVSSEGEIIHPKISTEHPELTISKPSKMVIERVNYITKVVAKLHFLVSKGDIEDVYLDEQDYTTIIVQLKKFDKETLDVIFTTISGKEKIEMRNLGFKIFIIQDKKRMLKWHIDPP